MKLAALQKEASALESTYPFLRSPSQNEEQSQEYAAIQFEDEMTYEAAILCMDNKQVSISMLQRRLRLGYARAAKIIDELEKHGIISAMEDYKRKVLMTRSEFNDKVKNISKNSLD